MALTPEDVVKKSFSSTHLRRGYDEQQVDDFLDEIVAELRRLHGENEELRTQLEECREGRGAGPAADTAEATGDAATAVPSLAVGDDASAGDEPATGAGGVEAELEERIARARQAAEQAEAESEERIARARQAAEQAEQAAALPIPDGEDGEQGQPEPGGAADTDEARQLVGAGAAGGAASVIALAQRLHDEHVQEGRSTRDRLVSEAENRHEELITTGQNRHDELIAAAQAQHDELVSTGQARHDELVAEGTTTRDTMIAEAEQTATTMVGEAEERRAAVLAELTSQRQSLTEHIEQLKVFERDYRARLKSFITDQLRTLEHTGVDQGPRPDGQTQAGQETDPAQDERDDIRPQG